MYLPRGQDVSQLLLFKIKLESHIFHVMFGVEEFEFTQDKQSDLNIELDVQRLQLKILLPE